MQFKHLTAKAKGSLFLILLITIGIGFFVMINKDEGDNTLRSKKRTTEVNTSVDSKENIKNTPDEKNTPETNNPSKSSTSPNTSGNGSENNQTQKKPDFGTVDGGEYYNNFSGRVEVYENPFFGMKVNFPVGWVMEDNLHQLGFVGKFDSSNHYLFTALILDKKLSLGVRAVKYPDGALKYIEGIKATKKYFNVMGLNVTQTQKEYETSEISEVTINNNKFYQVSFTSPDIHSSICYFVYPWKNGVIVFQSDGTDFTNDSQMLKELLNGITFSKSAASQIEIP